VSSATVSNVINDNGKVSETTRRAVLDVIEQLHYRPNASAQRRYRTFARNIVLVIKELHNPYFADVITGAQDAAEEAGYPVTVASSEGSRGAEDGIVDLLIGQDVSGIIIDPLLDSETDLTHLFELKRRRIPFVLLERVHGLRASLVGVDNATACRDAVRYLIQLGHEHIVHFAGPGYSMHSDERTEGFRQAFFESRLAFRQELVVPTGASLADGYRVGIACFGTDPASGMPTAVMCYNDLVAIGLLRALRELGLRVPEQVSVIGIDDIDLCAYASIPLTTVRLPRFEMGRMAVEMLIRQMKSGREYTIEQVTLEAGLVLRATTAPPVCVRCPASN
jgi:LacI family transcriptional regulator/LacI family repressor for deo operon, udp, cdd, tsx, nupC, and nupG